MLLSKLATGSVLMTFVNTFVVRCDTIETQLFSLCKELSLKNWVLLELRTIIHEM